MKRAARRSVRAGPWLLRILLLGLLPATAAADDSRRFLVLVSGLGGEPYYSELFQGWALDLLDVAHQKYGIDDAQTWYLAEAPDAEGRVDAVARKAAVMDTLARVAKVSSPGDRVLLVLIGHGTAQGAEARFNLPGTDLQPEELARALAPLRDRRLAVVNTTPASAGFLRPLAAAGRIVITATASNAETQHTRFAGFFVDALGGDAADADKDRRVSLLEAFRYAEREVERSYQSESRLRVEHAQLEDNGDAEASRQPDPESGDGALARAYRAFWAAPHTQAR